MRFIDSKQGVSSVVSAVLLFALFTTVAMLWTLNTLPQWIGDNEANHSQLVKERMDAIRDGLDALSATDGRGPIGVTIPLAAPAVPMVQQVSPAGSLAVAGNFQAQASFVNPQVQLVDGETASVPTEPISGNSFANIRHIESLIVSMTSASVNPSDSARALVVIDDGTRQATLQFTHAGKSLATMCAEAELRIAVTGPAGSYSKALLCGVGTSLNDYPVDLLEPSLGLKASLASMVPPFDITLTDSVTAGSATVNAKFAAVFEDMDGSVNGIGSSASLTFALDVDGPILAYQSQNQAYPGQTYVFEGGAVILKQSQGTVMASTAPFDVVVQGASGTLTWTLVELSGQGSLSGSAQAQATLTRSQTESVVLKADSATFTLTSDYADAWRASWSNELLLSSAGAAATVTGTGNQAVLNLLNAGGVTSWTLRLNIISASVNVS